jgi:hypothetical protein
MNNYFPDNWVVIKLKGDDPHYRVLAGWSGGYTTGDSWRMNSGITRHEFDGDYWYFYGSSGSFYKCYVDSYGLRMNNAYIWEQLQEKHDLGLELVLHCGAYKVDIQDVFNWIKEQGNEGN